MLEDLKKLQLHEEVASLRRDHEALSDSHISLEADVRNLTKRTDRVESAVTKISLMFDAIAKGQHEMRALLEALVKSSFHEDSREFSSAVAEPPRAEVDPRATPRAR